MKIERLPGELFFRALILDARGGFWLTTEYFGSREDVENFIKAHNEGVLREYQWPVQLQDDGIIYIPAKEEYEETTETAKSSTATNR